MGVFIANNGLISRDTSVITGSLNITGGITGSFFGTASNVLTASYTLQALTASYTAANLINSSSFSTTAVSASVALTASTVNGLFFGPTQNIGQLSPNIYLGSAISNNIVSTGSYNGTLLTPIIINKPCTLVTMSIAGGGASTNTTCSFGLYTNSTSSNLPEFLLAQGTIRPASTSTPTVYSASNFTPVKLQANTVYWVAFLTNGGSVSTFTNFRFLFGGAGQNFISYNPLLGYRTSVTTSVIVDPYWCISSGSTPQVGTSVLLALTASQNSGSYANISANTSPAVLPVLRVTYP